VAFVTIVVEVGGGISLLAGYLKDESVAKRKGLDAPWVEVVYDLEKHFAREVG